MQGVFRGAPRDGNVSGGHGSPFLDGSRGSWVTASDPLTHDNEITAQYLAIFMFLVGIKKLLTHSISPIFITGGFILIYDVLLSRRRWLSNTTMPRSVLVPCICVMAMGRGVGHGSCGSWVNCVMGNMDGSWVKKDDPFLPPPRFGDEKMY